MDKKTQRIRDLLRNNYPPIVDLGIHPEKTPANANDTGTKGEICFDASYIYVCTATDTWLRVAIETW